MTLSAMFNMGIATSKQAAIHPLMIKTSLRATQTLFERIVGDGLARISSRFPFR
jgi:hypothetical protein